jgi:hypothetical protein
MYRRYSRRNSLSWVQRNKKKSNRGERNWTLRNSIDPEPILSSLRLEIFQFLIIWPLLLYFSRRLLFRPPSYLTNLHTLDMIEEDDDKSWQCSKMLEYNEERGASGEYQLHFLVEWKNINNTQSRINSFVLLSLNNPTPIIAFARANNVWNKMPFCHLVQYCKSKTEVDIDRIQKVSTSPTCVKYKFGIQVPKGINNTIDLDKKGWNSLWQDAIETELKQFIDYQTFIVLHSGEDISKGYQKIPYRIVYDVKYDLRQKQDWLQVEIGRLMIKKTSTQVFYVWIQ